MQHNVAASLTQIPVTVPANEVPTKTTIRDIIGTFLQTEWALVDPDDLQLSYRTDFTNPQCVVERPAPKSGIAIEPLKLFVKFFDLKNRQDIEAFKHLIPRKDEEVIICHEFSLTGRGAKVYGSFRTEDGMIGRIDEFFDARNLEPEDVEDPELRADVARTMAHFHTMNSSLPGRPVETYYDALFRGLQKYHKMEKLKALGRGGGVAVDELVDYDFASRVKAVTNAMEAIAAKVGWCNHDVQFMNTMVKNDPKPGESKIVLVDFEFVMRNYRGFDIGGHFMQKMFKWFDEESKIADCKRYTGEEKQDFCAHYAQEWNRLTGDSDTKEQVFLESEYGYLLAITFDIHNMMWYMSEMDDKDPLSLAALNKLLGEFVSQYHKLGLQEPG